MMNIRDDSCLCSFRIIRGQIDLQCFDDTHMVGSWACSASNWIERGSHPRNPCMKNDKELFERRWNYLYLLVN